MYHGYEKERIHTEFWCGSLKQRVIKLRTIRWMGHISRVIERKNTYRVMVRKSETNIPL